MDEWTWNGARWWKFDFHSHTPASKGDYGKGPDQEALLNRSPDEWLLDYMRAGIDCVAVTDHNAGAWIDELKAALQRIKSARHPDFRRLYLFPGVELSVHGGVHLLAIFDPRQSTATIDNLLHEVRCKARSGKTDGVTEKSFLEVVQAIKQAGGLAIPAHVDEPSGLFRELRGSTLDQALRCRGILAIEVRDPSRPKPQLYQDLKLEWTEILGSDAHHPSGPRSPGSHFTWVKMGKPDIEGLRLSLLDGPLSVRRSDAAGGDPNQHAALALESIAVDNARYMGRSTAFEVRFCPFLNAVIGGRGTGKSTLVELLRLALRREGELPDSLVTDFDQYREVSESREDKGLLTGDSKLTVTYRKDRGRFRVQWSPSGDATPIEEQEGAGSWRPVEGDIVQRFPVDIYSQKQIFELARQPLALLRKVDEASEVDRRSWDGRWRDEETRFLSLRAKAREIEAGFLDQPRLRGELDDVKRKLAVFEETAHATVLRVYQRRQRQRRTADSWEESWSETGDQLRSAAESLVPDPLDRSSFSDDDHDLVHLSDSVVQGLKAIHDQLKGLAADADRALIRWRSDRASSSWNRSVESAFREYRRLCDKLAAEGVGDPDAYGELLQRRQLVEARLQDLTARRQQLDRVRRDAETSLGRLQSLRRELTRQRRRFLSALLSDNQYVRIGVVPYGTRELAENELRQILRREDGRFAKDIGAEGDSGLLGPLYVEPLGEEAFEDRLLELKLKVRSIATGEYDPGELQDQRFASYLGKLPPETLDRLDLWFPEDSLDVRYCAADGSYRPIQEGSPGQRTAALLAFFLSYGEEPIVLDQPEDDLDNQLIYDLIVTQLRQIKSRRQVIVVTHNANIVVNGDAELVVALAARRGETHKACEGSLQEEAVRETICAVMEGGREAFVRRYRRIVQESHDV